MKTAALDKNAVGGKSTHPTELIQKIQKGLRFSELKTLQDTLELPFEKLAAKLCISRSTLQRRKAALRVSPGGSDKCGRFSRFLRHSSAPFRRSPTGRARREYPPPRFPPTGPSA